MATLEDELGDIIAKARVGNGLTVGQLAASAGISARDLERIESYELAPDADTLFALARLLALDPSKLREIAAGAWVPGPVPMPDGAMVVEQISVPFGAYSENSYILGSRESGLAAVVDPGGADDKISDRLRANGLKLDAILVTHAHADHIGGIKGLLADWPGTKLVNHQLERDSIMHGLANEWEPAKGNIGFTVGDIAILPVFTPGHTPGSVCYHAGGVCFVGDTLFAGSIGRPSGPQVYRQMLTAIRTEILSAPDGIVLLPGHGAATTVGQEKAHNPFF